MARRKRAANGRGTIDVRPNGTVRVRLRLGPELGRQTFSAATEDEVWAKVDAARARLRGGRPIRDSSMLLADWSRTWRESALRHRVVTGEIEQSTADGYSIHARVHIEPEELGGVALCDLRATDVKTWMVKLLDEDDLGRSTVRSCWTVLAAMLDAAEEEHLIAENVCRRGTHRPAAASHEAAHLDEDECDRLAVELASEPNLLDFTELLLATGLRRGEGLGLAWPHVDLVRRQARVEQALKRTTKGLVLTKPKTTKSRRTVPLTDDAIEILTALRKRQVEQRLAAGPAWTPWKPKTGSGDLVFTTAIGGPIEPRNWLRRFQAAAERAGLPGLGIHALRHSAATFALRANVNIKVLSEMLGHSSVSITWDLYQHVADAETREAAEKLGAMRGRGRRSGETGDAAPQALRSVRGDSEAV